MRTYIWLIKLNPYLSLSCIMGNIGSSVFGAWTILRTKSGYRSFCCSIFDHFFFFLEKYNSKSVEYPLALWTVALFNTVTYNVRNYSVRESVCLHVWVLYLQFSLKQQKFENYCSAYSSALSQLRHSYTQSWFKQWWIAVGVTVPLKSEFTLAGCWSGVKSPWHNLILRVMRLFNYQKENP